MRKTICALVTSITFALAGCKSNVEPEAKDYQGSQSQSAHLNNSRYITVDRKPNGEIDHVYVRDRNRGKASLCFYAPSRREYCRNGKPTILTSSVTKAVKDLLEADARMRFEIDNAMYSHAAQQ